MKRYLYSLIGLMTAVSILGCQGSGEEKRNLNKTQGVSELLEAEMAKEDSKGAFAEDGSDEREEEPSGSSVDKRQTGLNEDAPLPEELNDIEKVLGKAEGVDVDLTALSSTMVYSEVYNMMVDPEKYRGKVVRMEGDCTSFYDDSMDKYYFACIVQDATACCAQGIEFVLTDDYKIPEDYPKDSEKIVVEGVFDTYDEDGLTYCTLKDARLI
ncbi:MAG: hypothetical protein K5931_06875 [Lachnospiraceae bacterium]|nr:hypothetical protein [Lachnospiraceae bacterium]